MLWGDSYRGNKLKKGTGDKEEEYMEGVQGITIMLMTCKRKTFACGVKERRNDGRMKRVQKKKQVRTTT